MVVDHVDLIPAGQGARFQVASRFCTSRGAFCFGGWHPFVAELRHPGTLRTFYRKFRPQTLSDLYATPSTLWGAQSSPRLLPWFETGLGDFSDDPLKRNDFFGPASLWILWRERIRLRRLARSINGHGYDPDRFGDIQGYFLVRGDEFRFFIQGGRHRAAVLASSGVKTLSVRIRQGFVPIVNRESVNDWPFVRSGLLAPDFALAVFDRFFEWNGEERADAHSLPRYS